MFQDLWLHIGVEGDDISSDIVTVVVNLMIIMRRRIVMMLMMMIVMMMIMTTSMMTMVASLSRQTCSMFLYSDGFLTMMLKI